MAAFPVAYSILLTAFYVPIILMLTGLIFRGIAFEFRFKASPKSRKIWDYSFHLGSIVATFFQGVILGTFVQGISDGISVAEQTFTGSSFDWLSTFSLMTGLALISGYALLGAAWLIMKTDEKTQEWAFMWAKNSLMLIIFFMILVGAWFPCINSQAFQRWFFDQTTIYFLAAALLIIIIVSSLFYALRHKHEIKPFWLSLGLFLVSYLMLIFTIWPWIVPYKVSIYQAAASFESLSLILIGVGLFLPIILAYTGYCYYLFRGKTTGDLGYHDDTFS